MNRSEAAKKRWENPEYRQHQIDVQTRAYSSPEMRAMNCKKAKEQWEDPVVREQIVTTMRKTRSTLECKRRISVAAIKRCENPDYIENASVAAKKRWESSDERKRASEIAKNRPPVAKETKKKMGLSQRHAHELDPELTMRKIEGRIGGFWYGNVKYWYVDAPQYCEKFNAEFKERVRAF